MTIYFMGSEDIDFTIIGSAGTPGNVNYYRGSWVRTAVTISNTGAADPPANRLAASFAAQSAFWFHARAGISGTANGTNNAQLVRFLDPSSNVKLAIRATAALTTWGVWTRTNAGVWTQLGASFTMSLPQLQAHALDVALSYSTTGSITVYCDGSQVFTYTGDVTTDGATQIARVEMADYNGPSAPVNWSEVIVCDSDSRSMGVLLLNPTTLTTGTLAQWSGTANNVNAALINDANFISSATAAQIQDYHTITALPSGIYSVLAVGLAGRASISTTGPQHIQLGLNIGGSRYWTGNLAPSLSFGNFANNLWQTNPNTGVAWTPADIIASSFNFSLQSVT